MTSSLRSLAPWIALSLSACGGSLPGQTDADGHECPLTAPRAEVTLVAYQSDAWMGLDVLSDFRRSTPVREAIGCQHRVVGACEVDECQGVGVDFVNGEPTCGYTSAGTLLVTRGNTALAPIEGSARVTLDHALTAGEPFSVRTTGADVPAFAATLDLPQRATVTGPDALTRGGSISLTSAEDLTVTWGPTTSRVVVIVSANNGGSFTAECAFEGAAGTGTLPASALPAQYGSVEVWTEERRDQQVGAFPAVVRARWSTGARASIARGG